MSSVNLNNKEQTSFVPETTKTSNKFKTILIITAVVVVVVVAVTLGLVFGLKKDKNKRKAEEIVEIVNSYTNTNELSLKFPIEHQTRTVKKIEEHIKNRLLTGFENWNRGYDAWKAWGNILYTNDSIYNVHGARFSLSSYQNAMNAQFKVVKIDMGQFHNMLINDNFCGIYYDIITKTSRGTSYGTVMEFVNFIEYGTDENPDTRVLEGWGSTNSSNYPSMKAFREPTEVKVEKILVDEVMAYTLPTTDNLKEKYIIKYPTTFIDTNSLIIQKIVLEGFEAWNKGISYYSDWLNQNLDTDAIYYYLEETPALTKDLYIQEMTTLTEKEEITRLYFENFLIRDNWAGIHYRYRRRDKDTNEMSVGDRMQFIKFEQKNDEWKIVKSWIK